MQQLALSPSQREIPSSHGLVSLWDMMEIKAQEFVDALRTFRALEMNIKHVGDTESEAARVGEITHNETSYIIIYDMLTNLANACHALGAN